jgi:predicted ATPase
MNSVESARPRRAVMIAASLILVSLLVGCAAADPEIVAIEYLRATHQADSDTAVALLDIDRIVERVRSEIVLVNTDGDPDRFLADSVETLIWGLFQETPRQENLGYDAPPAEIDGDRATVRVTLTEPDGSTERRTVYLRNTDYGWRVSGRSVDDLVAYVIQRLEERY